MSKTNSGSLPSKLQIVPGSKLALEVRLELFSERVWQWTPQGCSLQFTVDEQHFVLAQRGSEFAMFRQPQEIPLLMLADNAEFQDRLLIAIDAG